MIRKGRARRARLSVLVSMGLLVASGCDDSGTSISSEPLLTLESSNVAIAVGEGVGLVLTIDRTEFSGEVALSVRGTPSGVNATFDPSVTTGATSWLLLSVTNTATPGTYRLYVQGRSEAGSSERALDLTVTPAPPALSLSLVDDDLSVGQGASSQTGVRIARTSFTGTVRLSLAGAPAGVTWTFHPDVTDGDTSMLTVQVGADVSPGVYRLEARGASSQANGVATLTLTVSVSNPSFAVTLGRSSVLIVAGRTVNIPVTITRAPGYTDSVTLQVLQAPSLITWSFDPAVATGNGSVLTLGVRPGVPSRLFLSDIVTVIGTSPAGSSTATILVNIRTSPAGSSTPTIRVNIRGRIEPGPIPP